MSKFKPLPIPTLPIDKRFEDTIFVVEATHFEQHTLWKEHHEQLSWEEDSRGCSEIVGYADEMPVTVCFWFAKILGQRICFYESTSLAVHWGMVESWIMKQANPPKWDNDFRRAHCDAWNFHHCVAACQKKAEL
jgi:hypothetical protein